MRRPRESQLRAVSTSYRRGSRMWRPTDQAAACWCKRSGAQRSWAAGPDDRLAPRAMTTRRPEGVHHGQNEADQPDDEDDCSGGLNVDPADVSGHGPLQDRADGDQEDRHPNRHCAGLPRICLPRVERSKVHSSPYDQAARYAEPPGFADVSHAFVSTDARAATVVAAVSLLAMRGTRRPHQRRALTGRGSRPCPWPISRLGGRAPDGP